jgi:hypothetical protein
MRPCDPGSRCEAGADAGRKARLGVTLGNSLRRVLLSSLQGAAVTNVQIEGVLHEFSSLVGVREAVVDIVLNIKQLALRMVSEGPKHMTLRAAGPGPGDYTAKRGAGRRPDPRPRPRALHSGSRSPGRRSSPSRPARATYWLRETVRKLRQSVLSLSTPYIPRSSG